MYDLLKNLIKNHVPSPCQEAQLVRASPIHGKVASSIPGQGTYLGCRLDLQREPIDASLSQRCLCLSLSLLSSLSPVSKHILGGALKKNYVSIQENLVTGVLTLTPVL